MDTRICLLVRGYSRKHNDEIPPNELIKIIILFYTPLIILGIGDNHYGQLSIGKETQLKRWTELREMENLRHIKICRNWQSIMIVTANNELFVAGNNQYGRLGINEERDISCILNFEQINEPAITNMTQKIVSEGIGNEYHTFIYCHNHKNVNSQLYVLGSNNAGSLGIGTDIHDNQNYHLRMISKFWNNDEMIKSIQCATDNSLFLTDRGNLYISGQYAGRIYLTPQQIFPKADDNFNITAMAVGHHHFLALKSDGELIMKQLNRYSKFKRESRQKMQQYFDENQIKINKIECGKNHALVINTKGVCYAFGCNDESQCGIVGTKGYNILNLPSKVEQVSCGLSHNLVLTATNQLYSFGWNRDCQCSGLNTEESIKDPYHISKTKELDFEETVWIEEIIALPAESIIVINPNRNANPQ